MNFTREPIIETIITPRDGYKLLLRNSKCVGIEEYQLDALEVVCFGQSLFFRSLERPRSFLVPVADYEIIEIKEIRVPLKNVSYDRSIKIGGGKENTSKSSKDVSNDKEEVSEAIEVSSDSSQDPSSNQEQKHEKKRNRGKNRRRRSQEEVTLSSKEQENILKDNDANHSSQTSEAQPLPVLTRLIPPPPNLISETMSRYKDIVSLKPSSITNEESSSGLEGKNKSEEPSDSAAHENTNSDPIFLDASLDK
ncbi:MAG: hypothetical protein ACOVOR_03680 [Rhabdochlamydiaceae bacterium]